MNKLPQENELYYFDKNGLMVFTEKYHLQRGDCCNCGCRHCPYKKEKPEDSQKEGEKSDSEKNSG